MKTLFTKHQIQNILDSAFTKEQIQELSKPTPKAEIEIKTDGDGNTYKTVRASFMKTRLNQIFGFSYDFQIISKDLFQNEVLVHGRLTIRTNGCVIIREQFGKHNLQFETKTQVNRTASSASNTGNAFKSAATDAFKKCASEIGLCWDVYSQEAVELKKEVTLEKETHAEKKITERLEHFLNQATTEEELEIILEQLQEGFDLTNNHKILIEARKAEFLKIS